MRAVRHAPLAAGKARMNTIDLAAYEGDIVSRLRNWRGLHLAHTGRLFEEAASEIERLRELVDCHLAAIETAGFIYRNTDSGPNLVRPHYHQGGLP